MLRDDVILRQINRLVEGILQGRAAKKQDPITWAVSLDEMIEDLFGLSPALARRLSPGSLRSLLTAQGPHAPVALGVLLCQSEDERDVAQGRALLAGVDLDDLPPELAALVPGDFP